MSTFIFRRLVQTRGREGWLEFELDHYWTDMKWYNDSIDQLPLYAFHDLGIILGS